MDRLPSDELRLLCKQREAKGTPSEGKCPFLKKEALIGNLSLCLGATCVPDILDPDIGACREEQPVYRDK